MAASTSKSLPEWATVALNGGSHRKPYPWRAEPGDTLAGEVVESRTVTKGSASCVQLIIRVEGGSHSAGEPLPPGDWLQLDCVGAVLRRWVVKEEPKAGDKVAVECRSRSGRWPDFVAGVYRDDATGW
jgi:hypothetical protein